MAEQFLAHLPKVNRGILPKKSECMICRFEYGTVFSESGIIEHAVWLPCHHHVGSECIEYWLSPSKEGRNNCPHCRAEFYPAAARPYMEHAIIENEYTTIENELSNEAVRWVSIMRRISQYGYTRAEAGNGGDGTWRYDNNISVLIHTQSFLNMVRETVARQSLSGFGPPRVFSSPAEMESYVTGYSSAIQTLELREAVLYRDFQAAGVPLPQRTSDVWWMPLDDESYEALFQHLDRLGAFNGFENSRYVTFPKRELWEVFRKEGKVWQSTYDPINDPENRNAGTWFAF